MAEQEGQEVMQPWPERIIHLSAEEKGRLMRRDPERYWSQVKAERLAEIRGTLDQPTSKED
jgi:hypothetical protein